jgi:hypothetical protein
MQSVGASEKVFRLMDLVPSNHVLSKGKLLGEELSPVFLLCVIKKMPRKMCQAKENISQFCTNEPRAFVTYAV